MLTSVLESKQTKDTLYFKKKYTLKKEQQYLLLWPLNRLQSNTLGLFFFFPPGFNSRRPHFWYHWLQCEFYLEIFWRLQEYSTAFHKRSPADTFRAHFRRNPSPLYAQAAHGIDGDLQVEKALFQGTPQHTQVQPTQPPGQVKTGQFSSPSAFPSLPVPELASV